MIAKPMNRCAACGDPRAERGTKGRKMTKKEMIEWFKSAPMGSRQQRMLWAARKVARLTGATDGGAYQTLESALIEAERLPRLNPRDANDGDNITIIRRDRQRCEYRSAYGSVFAWLVLRGLGLDCVGCRPSPGSTASSATSYETQAGRTEAPTARSPVAGTVD